MLRASRPWPTARRTPAAMRSAALSMSAASMRNTRLVEPSYKAKSSLRRRSISGVSSGGSGRSDMDDAVLVEVILGAVVVIDVRAHRGLQRGPARTGATVWMHRAIGLRAGRILPDADI